MLKKLTIVLCIFSFALVSSAFSAPNKNAYKNANENASFKRDSDYDKNDFRDRLKDKYDEDDVDKLKDKYDDDDRDKKGKKSKKGKKNK